MKIRRETYDGTQQEFIDELFSKIRPTTDEGEQLKRRIQRVQSFLASKCGEFGGVLTTKWLQNERDVSMLMPITMVNGGGIEAILEMNVCLYDDLQYPNKLTNVEI